jgi:hypothetical protein
MVMPVGKRQSHIFYGWKIKAPHFNLRMLIKDTKFAR